MSISSDTTDHIDTAGTAGTAGSTGKASASAGTASTATPLAAQHLDLAYDHRQVITDLDVEIAPGKFTVIVGPNACGKSTLLRALARLMTPAKGTVLLDGGNIAKLKTKQIAKRLGLLPQTSIAPDGITVAELVARGRH
ncbi:MAG: ATP-binding cassette domain-containing protein, partial [Brevibacterium aurantiacum]